MKYCDLIENQEVFDHIISQCSSLERNLSTKQSELEAVWFELELSNVVDKGEITLIMHCLGLTDVIATIDLNANSLSVTGSKRFDVGVDTTEQILANCFYELKRKSIN